MELWSVVVLELKLAAVAPLVAAEDRDDASEVGPTV